MKSLRDTLNRLKADGSHGISWLRIQMMPPELFWPSWFRLILLSPVFVALNYVWLTWFHGQAPLYFTPVATPLMFLVMVFSGRGRPITGLLVGMVSGLAVVAIGFRRNLLASVPWIIFITVVTAAWLAYDNRRWRKQLAEEAEQEDVAKREERVGV